MVEEVRMELEEVIDEEKQTIISKHIAEIAKFFSGIRTPIKLRDFCYSLPDEWYIDSTVDDFSSISIAEGNHIYRYILYIDYEIDWDAEEPVIKKLIFRGVQLSQVVGATSYDAFGLFEESNLCTSYTEWGL